MHRPARVGRWLAKQRYRLGSPRARARRPFVASFALQLSGLLWFTVAAWNMSPVAGMIVAGLSCWVLDWRSKREGSRGAA
jgi:hypothetical protein